MGRREKKAARVNSPSSGEERKRRKAPSDDDAEANEDLSLKIVQKSIERAFRNSHRDSGVSGVVVDSKEEEEKKKEKRRRKKSNATEVLALSNGVSEVVADLKEEEEEEEKKKTERKKNNEAEVAALINKTRDNGVSEVVTVLKEEKKKNEKRRRKKSNENEVPALSNSAGDNGVSEVVTGLKEEEKKKEKRRRKKSNATDVPALDNRISEAFQDLKEEKKKKETRRRKKSIETEVPGSVDIDTGFRDFCGDMVDNVKRKENLETDKATDDPDKSVEVEANLAEVPDNTVLKKLLRGPRYFDTPDSNWRACYNCGEDGHTIANCTSAKRKKPCFVCGSFEHNAKQCTKGRDCFICKQHGHRAKDCTEKYTNSKLCLRCGDLGHEMFSCRNDYSPDDIKDMQCYICQQFGHLCCINYSDSGPTEVSCYRCGLSGHTGLACMASYRDNNAYDTPYVASSCYKCGVEGHFARECTSSAKTSKRTRDPSTPKQRSSKKIKDHTGPYSAPHDLGKSRKVKKTQYGEFASPSKTNQHRGYWTTEYSDDHYHSNQTNANNWRSPVNSSYKRRDMFGSPNGDYESTYHSSKKPHFDNSAASGSSRSYQHRYSASRFSNTYGNDSRGRNNDWW